MEHMQNSTNNINQDECDSNLTSTLLKGRNSSFPIIPYCNNVTGNTLCMPIAINDVYANSTLSCLCH